MVTFANAAARAAMERLPPDRVRQLERLVAAEVYYGKPTSPAAAAEFHLTAGVRHAAERRFRHSGEDMRLAVDAVVDALILRGELLLEPEANGMIRLRLAPQPGETQDPGERAAAFRRRLAERLGRDMAPEGQAELALLFASMRQAARLVTTRNGTLDVVSVGPVRFAMLAATGVRAGATGVAICDALVFAILECGAVHAYEVAGERLRVAFPCEDDVRVSADLDGLNPIPREPGPHPVAKLLPLTKILLRKSRHELDWAGITERTGHVVPPSARSGFSRALSRGSANKGKLASALLRRELDKEIVSATCRVAISPTLDDHNWFAPASARVAAYRRQAAAAYPLLVPVVMASPALTGVVDRGEELAGALGARIGLPPAILRRVGRLFWQRTGAETARALREPTRTRAALALCAPERLPRDRAEWKGFRAALVLAEAVENLASGDRRGDGIWSPLRKSEGVEATWMPDAGQLAILSEAVAWASRDWRAAAAFDTRVGDMAADVQRVVALSLRCHPALSAAMAPEPGWTGRSVKDLSEEVLRLAILGENPGLRSLCERTTTWHARGASLRTRLADIACSDPKRASVTRWPALDQEFRSSDGGRILWLTDKPALAAESEELKHCVWSYTWQCVVHGSHIGSVTGRDGGRSTVEFRAKREGENWSLVQVQHYGLEDGPPSESCVAVVAEFRRRRGTSPDFPALERAREIRMSLWDEIGGDEPFTSADPEQARAAFALYAPFLSREGRRLGQDGLAEALAAPMLARRERALLQNATTDAKRAREVERRDIRNAGRREARRTRREAAPVACTAAEEAPGPTIGPLPDSGAAEVVCEAAAIPMPGLARRIGSAIRRAFVTVVRAGAA